ncbi:cytochrome P450 [Serratia oryzae]|uniref:cytochrome P450 n=1 Tax=Serratia oryzae TaxID=2034155 RepID=UPI0012E1E86D|nr:cytochrome P450 [Serratia oryzae]
MALCPFSVATPQAVRAALTHADLGVRPPHEPVPTLLLATPAQPLFAALVRMRDDAGHTELKAAISTALASFSDSEIYQLATRVAQSLAPGMLNAEQLTRFSYALPIGVLAELLGVAYQERTVLVDNVLDFVRCIAPGGSEQQMASGAIAAGKLHEWLRAADGPLFIRLCQHIGDRTVAIANAIGLFFQACEGTAGLLGQTLLLMQERHIAAKEGISSVLQHTPPIYSTRRFALRATELGGEPLTIGQAVLISLQTEGESFAFGYGSHRCPGAGWAQAIALSGIHHLLTLKIEPELLAHFRWRVSQNARVPEFFTAEE